MAILPSAVDVDINRQRAVIRALADRLEYTRDCARRNILRDQLAIEIRRLRLCRSDQHLSRALPALASPVAVDARSNSAHGGPSLKGLDVAQQPFGPHPA
jgi:hypothetical protein